MLVFLMFPFVSNVLEDETEDPFGYGEILSNDIVLREQIADLIHARHPDFKIIQPLQVVAESLYGGWCETWEGHRRSERAMLRRLRKGQRRPTDLEDRPPVGSELVSSLPVHTSPLCWLKSQAGEVQG